MFAAALNNLTSLVTGENKVNQLTELFQVLITACLNQSSSTEQNDLAREIDKLFNTTTAKTPALYDFLTVAPPKSRKKLIKRLKNLKPTDATTANKSTKKPSSASKRITKKTAKRSATKRKSISSPRNVTSESANSRRLSSSTTSTSFTNLTTSTYGNNNAQPGSSSSNTTTKTSTPSSSSNDAIATGTSNVIYLNESEQKVGKKASSKLAQLLKAIELASDQLAVMVLCRLLEGFSTIGSTAVKQRHLRQLAKIDAANHLLRAIRTHLSDANPTPFVVMATEILITTTVRACAKDTKLLLKIRLIGLLQLLTVRILEVDRIHCTLVLLKFTCKALKSPRNSQLMGRDRQFAERFTNVLVAFNAMESADSVPYVPRTSNPDAYSAADKMARLVEILFYVTKNRKNKLYLLDQGVIGVLKSIFENHFQRRGLDLVHSEIALISVAVIRHLSKTRRAKDELATLNILEMCENSIAELADDRSKFANKKTLLANSLQLQDSLCALCIRCLPQLPFPVPTNNFPLNFPIPPDTKLQLPRSKHNSLSVKSRPNTVLRRDKSLDNNDSAIDDIDSEDDGGGEEEEDSFMGFTGSKILADETIDDQMNSDDEGDRETNGTQASSALPRYSRQKLNELRDHYAKFFHELDNGALRSTPLSPKLRRNNQGGIIETSASLSTNTESVQTHKERLSATCQQTKSVGEFVKIAYPELADPNIETERKDLLSNQESMRETVIQKLAKARVQAQNTKTRIVYDLDQLHNAESKSRRPPNFSLENNDLERCGRFVTNVDHLCFESRFESGNLRTAIQVTETHYELVLSPDINEARPHYQWFYFEVSNNQPNVSYTFEIINCLKNTSMFSKGMQPVIFSVTEAKQGRPGWVRAGQSVCYYRNLYFSPPESPPENIKKPLPRRRTQSIGPTATPISKTPTKQANNSTTSASDVKSYFSIRFTIRFRHPADVCYIAYHYPYTFSYLQSTLEMVIGRCSQKATTMYVRCDRLTRSLAGNPLQLVTITANGSVDDLRTRHLILIMARVHPGESNSSWIMHGVLQALTADTEIANRLRERFVFKVIPCLNPDGVINGNHRCSLAGIDLNRVWDQPSSSRHPSIYHTKGLVQYMVEIQKRPPFCIIDLHGHSRKSNVFTYGNNPEESWRIADSSLPNSGQVVVLPELLDKLGQGFSLQDCRFSITKSKESSARITLWRQFGIERCYTVESTYAGFDTGCYAGKQIGIADLKRMGENLVQVLLEVYSTAQQGNIEKKT